MSIENTLRNLLNVLKKDKSLQHSPAIKQLLSPENTPRLLNTLQFLTKTLGKDSRLDNLSEEDIVNDPALRKLLTIALVTALLQQEHPPLKFNFKLLFKKERTGKEMLELRDDLKESLKLLHQKDSPQPLDDTTLTEIADRIALQTLDHEEEHRLTQFTPSLHNRILVTDGGDIIDVEGDTTFRQDNAVMRLSDYLSNETNTTVEEAELREEEGISLHPDKPLESLDSEYSSPFSTNPFKTKPEPK